MNKAATEPEDNTMLNKVIVFVIFGPKCIFNASKNCQENNPLMSHGVL